MEAFAIPFLLFVGGCWRCRLPRTYSCRRRWEARRRLDPAAGDRRPAAPGVAGVAGSLGAFGRSTRPSRGTWSAASGAPSTSRPASCCSPASAPWWRSGYSSPARCSPRSLLDGFGWLGVAQDAPGAPALLGAAAVVAGAWLIVRAQAGAGALEEAARGRSGGSPWRSSPGRCSRSRGRSTPSSTPSSTQRSPSAPFRSSSRPPRWRCARRLVAAGAPAPGSRRSRRALVGWLGGLCGATYVTAVFSLLPEIGASTVSCSPWPVNSWHPSPSTATASCASPPRDLRAAAARRRDPAGRRRADHPGLERREIRYRSRGPPVLNPISTRSRRSRRSPRRARTVTSPPVRPTLNERCASGRPPEPGRTVSFPRQCRRRRSPSRSRRGTSRAGGRAAPAGAR